MQFEGEQAEKYITMCEKAIELQERHSLLGMPYLEVGDFYWLGKDYLKTNIFICDKRELVRGDKVWIPRQDQLQEMVYKDARADAIIEMLESWRKENYEYELQFISMEQLWLAFVMKEKYNKIWDNGKEEWRTDGKKAINRK
jgi:hypothetical protein